MMISGVMGLPLPSENGQEGTGTKQPCLYKPAKLTAVALLTFCPGRLMVVVTVVGDEPVVLTPDGSLPARTAPIASAPFNPFASGTDTRNMRYFGGGPAVICWNGSAV